MSINTKVQLKFWARSGGYCGNPGCHCELLPFFESGNITSIEEMAHIIGRKEDGPRGDDELPLNGRDAADVERDLAAGIVRKSTLDKIAKLNKDLADTCLEHIQMNPLVREFWKQMAHIKIEHDKAGEQERLAALQIPVTER